MAAKRGKKKPRPAQRRGVGLRRPILILTINGQKSQIIVAPRGANDLRIIWGVGILGGGGYWTKFGKEIPGSRFIFLPGINDFHFSTTGRFRPKKPPLVPPPGANDVEIVWRGEYIIEAWWTRDGERFERIELAASERQFNCEFAAS